MRSRKYSPTIWLDGRGLKRRLHGVHYPKASAAPSFIEHAPYEVRPNTIAKIEAVWRASRGRKIKTVAQHLYEGEGRYARKLYNRLGQKKFAKAWLTYPIGVYIDFAAGEGFKDGDEVDPMSVITVSSGSIRWNENGIMSQPARTNLLGSQ